MSQKIPLTGGTLVGRDRRLSRIDLFGDQTNKYWQTTPVVIGLQQDLFKPRTLVWDEKVQSLSASVAERQYLEAREDVAGNTAAAFFDLYAAQMTLANATANAAVNDTLYTLNKGRFEVGKIGENELLKSELAAAPRARGGRRRQARARSRRGGAAPQHRLSRRAAARDRDARLHSDRRRRPRRRRARGAQELEHHRAVRSSTTCRRSGSITEARLNNRLQRVASSASVGFNQTASVFGQAYQSPLGKQQLQVGVNMPMIQWGAGRADVEAAKADEQRTAANNKSRRDALVEDARFSVLAAPAGAAQRAHLGEGRHRRRKGLRRREEPLHHRQDRHSRSV